MKALTKEFWKNDDEISIGDFVLTGGEAGNGTGRGQQAIPGVLSNCRSYKEESIRWCLEYPQYTGHTILGRKVPGDMLSGHHANIEKWRGFSR